MVHMLAAQMVLLLLTYEYFTLTSIVSLEVRRYQLRFVYSCSSQVDRTDGAASAMFKKTTKRKEI
jgi:hypothetical protein